MTKALHPRWASIARAAAIVCGLGAGSAANAAVVLSFAQNIDGPTVTATNNLGDTTTTVAGTDIPVTISQYLGEGAPIDAYLNFTLLSSSVATVSSGQLLEPFNGSFSFTSLIGGGGINYLSSTFADFVFGIDGGSSLTLNSSQPPGTVAFTSDILDVAELQVPRALSFAFADVTPPGNIVGTTLDGFVSSVSGTISADFVSDVPEPPGLALLGVGVGALAVLRRRRAAKVLNLNFHPLPTRAARSGG